MGNFPLTFQLTTSILCRLFEVTDLYKIYEKLTVKKLPPNMYMHFMNDTKTAKITF